MDENLTKKLQEWLEENNSQIIVGLLTPTGQSIPIIQFGFMKKYLQENPGWQVGVMVVENNQE